MRWMLFISACFCLAGGKPVHSKKPFSAPNVIIIFMDDLGYGDLSCYGATGYTTTHLDALAAQGMRFTDFLSAQAVCSASRAGLLTGCYPNRLGIWGALMPSGKTGLHANETTIAELLKARGYATAVYGKWHLGHQKPFLPLQHGFDEYFGLPYSNDMWPVNFDGSPALPEQWKSNYPPLPLIAGNEPVDTVVRLSDQALLTRRYTEKALDFISRNRNRPFFLYLPHSMPHVPIAASAAFRGKSRQGLYGDVMMEMDWSVGEIIKALRAYRIEENTLIVFTSDNGPWLNFGNHAGSSGGLREGKGTVFEGGHRVPCIMQWKGVIPAGTVCNGLASTLDILPTIAGLCHTSLPESRIDGVSLAPLLRNPSGESPRREFYYYYDRNALKAVRSDHWKLVFSHQSRSYLPYLPGNDGNAGSTSEQHAIPMALYDLRRDRGEQYDVQALYPDVVKKLMEIADRARNDLGDELTGVQGSGRRSVGMVQQP